MMNDSRAEDMSTRAIADTDAKRRLGFAFALVLLLLLAGFLAMTPDYPPRSRLFPLLVGIPTFLCLALVILAYVSDTADRIVLAFDAAFFRTDTDLFESEESELDLGAIRRALGWIIGALLAFYLVGFVVTTLGFVYAYLRIEGQHDRRRSLLLAAVTTAFMYGLFVAVFGVRLGGGLLPTLLLDALRV